MTPDPKPLNTISHRDTECSVLLANTYASVLTILHLLEMQRAMKHILLKKFKVFPGHFLH